jgi:osmotically-inducible protein OsmY
MNSIVVWTIQQKKREGRFAPGLGARLFMIILFATGNVWTAESSNSPAITDQAIALAVESELRADGVVPMDPIDISVQNGIVSYKGKVNNLLAKERATMLAETVKGVRTVVNQLQVIPSKSDSDLAVKQRVIDELSSDSLIEPANFHVVVEDGIVMLDGPANSWHEKFIAGEIVKRVQGVKGIDNKLVRGEENSRPDSDIKKEIVKRLKFDVWVPEDALEVTVDQGTVILTGTVGSAFAKRKAYQHAWSLGVKEVKMEGVEVDPNFQSGLKRDKKPVSSGNIQEAVIDAISYDSRVANLPEVDVKGGVVTLTGKVNSLQAKEAAEENAKNTIGVWYVRNYLKVRPLEPLTDLEIGKLIREALERNSYLTRWNISVRVFNEGTVYLAGRVGTFFEKKQAEETAARVNGVTKILNRLRVNAPWLRKDDAEIREDVKNQLWWTSFVDSENITVSVDDGLVTLQGTVETWQERRIAAKNAYDGGARSVRNKLTVENFEEQEL